MEMSRSIGMHNGTKQGKELYHDARPNVKAMAKLARRQVSHDKDPVKSTNNPKYPGSQNVRNH